MAILAVPLSNDARQTISTALDGQMVDMDIWWQPSDQHWYISMLFQNENEAIIAGRRMLHEIDVLAGVASRFSGTLTPLGTTETIGRNAWGMTHELIYRSES